MHPEAARVLEKLGGDASGFAARQLTSRIAANADLVVVMTRTHRDAVLELAPRRFNQTFTLREAAYLVSECNACDVADLAASRQQLSGRQLTDIADPIGQDQEFFAGVGAQIADLVPSVLKLCQ
jgi:protein-tyrosine phosphatase